MSTQLAFGFGDHRPALGRENFLVAPCNAHAVALIDHWPDWPCSVLVLAGPEGAGKTHLAEVWRARSGASILGPDALADVARAETLTSNLLIDGLDPDAPLGPPHPDHRAREMALCRFLDAAARRREGTLLVTAHRSPSTWAVELPDLRTRLAAMPVANLGPPDDELMRRLADKLFADRQLQVPDQAAEEMLALIERSSSALILAVDALDHASLEAQQRVLTRAFVRSVLAPEPETEA